MGSGVAVVRRAPLGIATVASGLYLIPHTQKKARGPEHRHDKYPVYVLQPNKKKRRTDKDETEDPESPFHTEKSNF